MNQILLLFHLGGYNHYIHMISIIGVLLPLIVIAGSITSSIKYNNLNDGKAIPINITAGVIVHTNF